MAHSSDPTQFGEISQVHFATHMSYAEEEDDLDASGDNPHVIHIVRSGALHTECSVDWFTDPDSKFANVKFKATRETVTFRPHECLKKVELAIKANTTYDNVVEVSVKLDSAYNCEIFQNMSASRVKIIDYDVFPTDRFEKETLTDRTTTSWKDGKDFAMLTELGKLLWSHNKRGAIKQITADFLENLIFIGQMEVGRRVVQCLSNALHDGSACESDAFRLHFDTLMVYASILVSLNGFLHASAYFRNFWGVGGGARKILLLSLMERFLYFEEASRSRIDTSQFRLTFAQDSFRLVADGYMKMFLLLKCATRVLLIALYFQAMAVRRYIASAGVEYQLFLTLVPIIIVPLLLRAWVALRRRVSDMCRENTVEAQVALMNHMTNCVDNYSLIAEHNGRPMALGQCEEKVIALNKCMTAQALRSANDDAMFGWLSVLMEFVVIVTGGYYVLSGSVQLGTFTALLKGIKSCMGQYKAVFSTFMKMQSTFPGLWHVVQFVNFQTDLQKRFDKQQRDMEELESLVEAQRDQDSGRFTVDSPIGTLSITMKNLEFKYRVEEVVTLGKADGSPFGIELEDGRLDENKQPSALKILSVDGGLVQKYNDKHKGSEVKPGDYITAANGLMGSAALIREEMEKSGELNLSVERATTAKPLLKLDLTIPTGKLVAVTGPANCGISTLLKMIAGTLLPEPGSGEVFIPPHFRVLHVSYRQQLWTGPVGESVFFGSLTGTSQNIHLHQLPKTEIERGIKICRMLRIPDNVISAIEASLDDSDESTTKDKKKREKARHDSIQVITSLADTTIAKMQLAAALIDNPHVLVVNKAYNKFSLEEQDIVLNILRTFVEHRGVEMNPDEYLDRKPRTCVFSSTTPLFLSSADLVYELRDGELIDSSEEFHRLDREEQAILQCRRQVHERKQTLQKDTSELVQRLSSAKLHKPGSPSQPESQQPAPPFSVEDPPNTAAGTANEKQPLLAN